MTTKARYNNAPAIDYDACIRAFVPYAREDGRMFTVGGCPSHPFFVLVRRAADTSKNPAAVRIAVHGLHEQQYHGSIEERWNAVLALAEYDAQPFWYSTEAEAQEAHQHYLSSRKASQVKEETHVTNSDQFNDLGAAG